MSIQTEQRPDGEFATPQPAKLILAVTRVTPSTQVCAAQGDAQMFKLQAQYYALVASESSYGRDRILVDVMSMQSALAYISKASRHSATG